MWGDNMRTNDERLDRIEKRLEELERLVRLNKSEAIEAYNVAVINQDKINELKKSIRRYKKGR